MVATVCDAFLKHCEYERRLSENTISAYAQDLAEFTRRFGDRDVASISGTDLVAYADFLSTSRRLAPASVKRRIACARSLFSWLARKSLVACDPFKTVDIRVRIPDRLPRCLTSAEMVRLTRAAVASTKSNDLIVNLLFATGVRVSELAAVRVGDIDVQSGTIRIIGKGNRERQVFVSNPDLCDRLSAYLRTNRLQASANDHLLVSSNQRPLSPVGIRSRVKRLAVDAKISRTVTPHVVRHTSATALLEAGVDIRFVQRLLGHRSISTTQLYTHVSDRALRSALLSADICGRMEAGGR